MIPPISVLSPVTLGSRCQSMVFEKAWHVVHSSRHAAKCVLKDMPGVWSHAVAMSQSCCWRETLHNALVL